MFISPHTHCESILTGSTIDSFIDRAKELKRTHFAYTDNGHMSSSLKVYKKLKGTDIKFISGIEIYFKDSVCPFVTNTSADRCKYFTASIYCKDQNAYEALSKIISEKTFATIEIQEEKQQLWTWAHLVEISNYNVDLVLGGVHCMVGKTLLAGEPKAAQDIFLKLKQVFGEKLYTSIVAEPWNKKWNNVIEIKYEDGTSDAILSSDLVDTDRARRIRAIDLFENKNRHSFIKSKKVSSTYYTVNKAIDSVKLHKGFLPLPDGDALGKINKFLFALSNKYKVKTLVSDYAYYANKEDKIVQTMVLEGKNKLQPNFYMKSEEDIKTYLTTVMGFSDDICNFLLKNNEEWAKKYDNFELKFHWRLAECEGSAVKQIMDIIKQNGRMKWDDPKYVSRLRTELEVIHLNGVYDLLPYFLPIRDVLNHYKENGELTGPGRGSSGGALLCYLLGITQIDPFKYDLPFQRFFSMVRIKNKKLPDVDVDLGSRELLVGKDKQSGYLFGRWGNKAAQISTRTTIRLKSAILDANRYINGKVEDSIATLSKGLPTPPQGVSDHQFVFGYEDSDNNHIPGLIEISDELKKYAQERPKEWEIVSKALGLTRAFSKHASAYVLSDVPIKDVMPTKEGYITQYEAKECEEAGLIKYDFLVVKQLKDLEVCLNLINKKNNVQKVIGQFDHQGKELYIWDLPEDPEVFKSVWSGKTETVFQLNSSSMTPYVIEMLPQSIMDIAILLALDRPGPLDYIDSRTGRNMMQEYMMRRKGLSEADIKVLSELLPNNYGIIIFQENLNKIARELAGFSAEDAEILRENMAKKHLVKLLQMKPQFVEGASQKISKELAENIWDQMVTFGRYGFSVIHAVEYSLISYACMFLKHYYPLEWWAAVLTNADEKEITGVLWPYVKDIVDSPDINLSSDTMVVDYANGKIRSKLGIMRGVGDKTIEPIVNNRPYKDIQDFVDKGVCGPSLARKLIHVGVLDSLFKPHATLLEKLQAYEDAVEIKIYNNKVQIAEVNGKKVKASEPKKGKVPEEYLNIHPIQDAAMRKAVLPSMPINFFDLGSKYSKALIPFEEKISVASKKGHATQLVNGSVVKRLDELDGESIPKDIYIAATCFVIEAKEFSYAKNTKKALKMILDIDGYITEKVMWPDYETGELIYDKALKKGKIATVFLKKRANKKDMGVIHIVVET